MICGLVGMLSRTHSVERTAAVDAFSIPPSLHLSTAAAANAAAAVMPASGVPESCKTFRG